MKLASLLERRIGIKYYWDDQPGTKGILKKYPEDFVVQELITKELVAPLDPLEKIELPGRPGLFVHAIIRKRLVDHFTMERAVEKYFKIGNKDIGLAGIKDTVAVTSQRISLWLPNKPLPKEPIELLGGIITIFGWQRKIDQVYIGDLLGNRFKITVRDPETIPENLLDRLSTPKPNYYGIQRFGEKRPISHLVGLALIKGNYEEAVRIFIGDTTGTEEEEIKKIREMYLNGTASPREIADLLPNKRILEKKVLYFLDNHPNDFLGALKQLPERLLHLQVYAFQSFIFNQYLSIRMENDPFKPIPGETRGEETGMVLAPIPGGKKNIHGEARKIYQEILSQYGLDIKDINPPPETKIFIRRIFRDLFLIPRKSHVSFSDDKNYYVIRFDLRKGQYATSVLREIMKSEYVI